MWDNLGVMMRTPSVCLALFAFVYIACSDRAALGPQVECEATPDCPAGTSCQNKVCIRDAGSAGTDAFAITAINGTSAQAPGGRARVTGSGALKIAGSGLDGVTAVRLVLRSTSQIYNLIVTSAQASEINATLPDTIDSALTDAGLIGTLSVVHPTRGVASADVQILRGESHQLSGNNVTLRKSVCDTFPDGSECSNATPSMAAAYCNTDEILLSGGCMVPGAGSGVQLRALVSVTSAPIARVAALSHPTVRDEPQMRQGYDGDPVGFANSAITSTNAPMEPGTGWFCETLGTLEPIGVFAASWNYNIAAYAVCLKVSP